MQIKEITVNAGRTFNHPYEQFSNLRPSVAFQADLAEGEDPEKATKELQAKAEKLVEDHKQNILRSLKELHDLELRQQEVRDLETSLKQAQNRLDEIRKENPQLQLEGRENPSEDILDMTCDCGYLLRVEGARGGLRDNPIFCDSKDEKNLSIEVCPECGADLLSIYDEKIFIKEEMP